MSSTGYTPGTASITIDGVTNPVTAGPSSDLVQYKLTSASGSAPDTNKDANMEITGLPAGGQVHTLTFKVRTTEQLLDRKSPKKWKSRVKKVI